VTGSSRFVVGLEGASLTAAERAAYSRDLPLGFLLLTRNLQTAVQAADLTAELRSLGKPEPILFVDQEGGAVDCSSRPAFTSLAWDDLSAAVAAFNELLAQPREIRAT
jgi:beta-glucosidase-like glycosyl hydrolase